VAGIMIFPPKKGSKRCHQVRLRVELLESRSLPSAAGWSIMGSGTTNDLYAIDSDVYGGPLGPSGVFAVGADGTILHSTNGWAPWIKQNSGTDNALYGITASTTSGKIELFVVGDHGTILHSWDAGNTWQLEFSGTSDALHSVYTYGDGNVFAVGDHGTILHSTDDGMTWNAQDSGTTATLYGVRHAGAVYVVGDAGTILRSLDFGKTWTALSSGTTATLRGVFLEGETIIHVVGDNGLILLSTDAGATWQVQPSGTNATLRNVRGEGDYLLAAGAGGTILRFADDGINTDWLPQSSGTTDVLNAALPAYHQAFAVGNGGLILHYTDGTIAPPAGGGDPWIVTGSDAGGPPIVHVYDAASGKLLNQFDAYDPHFEGGVRVALEQGNSSFPRIITAPGPGGGPDIRVFNGFTGALISEFDAYDPGFAGGVWVAAGQDVLEAGPTLPTIITGAGPGGGPHVRVFTEAGVELEGFYAYDPRFSGGVRVAAGRLSSGFPVGHFMSDIITAAGPGGGPHVKVFDGIDLHVKDSFMAYDPAFSGGVFVAAGDVNGDGVIDIITGAGAGGGPHVKVFNGLDGSVLQSLMAYDPHFAGGVRVSFVSDLNANGAGEIVTGAGPGGGPHVRVFDGLTLQELDGFYAYDPSFTGGLFVGGN
jgi:hypothetical protein